MGPFKDRDRVGLVFSQDLAESLMHGLAANVSQMGEFLNIAYTS